jgi:hypothetical protein
MMRWYNKTMEYGRTSHNRSVYASGAVAPSGYEKPQPALRPYGLCAVFLRHIFASPGNLRFPLSGLQKRYIQPERYVQLRRTYKKTYINSQKTYCINK